MPDQASSPAGSSQEPFTHTPLSTTIADLQTAVASFWALASQELVDAVHAVPKMLKWQALILVVGTIFWVSVCVSLGAAAYAYTHSVALGITGFLAPQLLCIVGLYTAIKRAKRTISLPYTRQALEEVMRNKEGS